MVLTFAQEGALLWTRRRSDGFRHFLWMPQINAYGGRTGTSNSPKAFAVLEHLVDHPGRIVTKDELLPAV